MRRARGVDCIIDLCRNWGSFVELALTHVDHGSASTLWFPDGVRTISRDDDTRTFSASNAVRAAQAVWSLSLSRETPKADMLGDGVHDAAAATFEVTRADSSSASSASHVDRSKT